MVRQTLHDQFLVSHLIVAILLGSILGHLKGLYSEDIIGYIIMMWISPQVIPFHNLIDENEEIQQCLGDSDIEDWDLEQYYLAVFLSRLDLDFDLQVVPFLSGFFPMFV